jgi:hypothetical protein
MLFRQKMLTFSNLFLLEQALLKIVPQGVVISSILYGVTPSTAQSGCSGAIRHNTRLGESFRRLDLIPIFRLPTFIPLILQSLILVLSEKCFNIFPFSIPPNLCAEVSNTNNFSKPYPFIFQETDPLPPLQRHFIH